MDPSPLLLVCVFLGSLVALLGLFRPFLGFLVFLIVHFVQPGELIPSLAPLHIELVYGVLLFAVIWGRKGGAVPLFKIKIVQAGILLLATGVLSIPLAVWIGGAVGTVLEMFKLMTIVVMIKLMIDTPERLRKLLWCLAVIGTWVAVSSLVAFSSGQFYELAYNKGNINRAAGLNSLVAGPNELAGFLLALIPFGVALFRTSRSVLAKGFLLLAGILSILAIVLAGSRTAFLGLLVIAFVFLCRAKRKVATAVVCVALLTVLWTGMPPEYKARYLTMQEYAKGGQLDDSNELRLFVWKSGWRIFLYDPIFGVGAGQFATGYGLLILKGKHAMWMQPHNLFIQTACELGILGLLALSNFLVQIAKGIGAVLHFARETNDDITYQIGLACAVMFAGAMLISVFGHTLYRPYWYLLGGLVAATQGLQGIEKKEQSVSRVVAPWTLRRNSRQHSVAARLIR